MTTCPLDKSFWLAFIVGIINLWVLQCEDDASYCLVNRIMSIIMTSPKKKMMMYHHRHWSHRLTAAVTVTVTVTLTLTMLMLILILIVKERAKRIKVK